MTKAKATERIRLRDGTVSTIGDALDAGVLVLKKTDKMYSSRTASGLRTAYFAEYPDTGEGWEISAGLYKSRTGEAVVPGAQEKPKAP